MKKGEKQLKLCNSDCVDTLCFGWLGRSTWKTTLTNDMCEVHKICSGIYLGRNPKQYADGSEWSEHKKHMSMIHFE